MLPDRANFLASLTIAAFFPTLLCGEPRLEETPFVIPMDQISSDAEVLRVSGLELGPDHPGLELFWIAELESASRDFTTALECLNHQHDLDTVDLRDIATDRIDALPHLAICLMRILSYIDDPEDVAQYLRDIGFGVVSDPTPRRLSFFRSTKFEDGVHLSGMWPKGGRVWSADYPLSGDFNSSFDTLMARSLGVVILLDDHGQIHELSVTMERL